MVSDIPGVMQMRDLDHRGSSGSFNASDKKQWGQVILRHTELAAYRCFLPDLAGFTGFYCTGPSPYSHARLSNSPHMRCHPPVTITIQRSKSGRYTRSAVWRRGWDSNPRSRCRDACFPSMSIRPLSHLSASRSVKGGILACVFMTGKADGLAVASVMSWPEGDSCLKTITF